jgi:diguanylate cyclase (GGDEF)-like protein
MSEGSKIEEAARSGIPFCVLLIDVDDFKQINDRYGHLTGDRVLQHSAAMLVECVRQSDIVARYGGEEFVILVNNCRLEKGRELAERIRLRFAQAPFHEGDRSIAVTVSIGVAQSDASQQTNMLVDMISRADKALYRAKFLGRNRVEIDDSAVQGGEDA